jgi:hypothetical protein
MRFFTVTDQSSIQHKILVIPLKQSELNEVVGQCQKCIPTITVSSIVQMGHAYVIIDFGADAWKTAVPLDEASEDGHRIGDELVVGDVLNIILTAQPNALRISGEKVYMNVPLESVLAFSFLYDAEIAENYALFRMMQQPKAE